MSYQDVKDKLYHSHRKIANNTYLELAPIVESDGTIEAVLMTLHHNTVAAFYPSHIELFSAGYHTRTTKDRLNLALELAKIYGQRIYQQNWQWYYWHYNHSHLPGIKFYDGIKIDYTGKVIGG